MNEMDEVKIEMKVSDLGSCAYLMMHGFKICGYDKREKSYLFSIRESDVQDFESKQDDYLNSEFHRFDAALVSIKKRYKTYLY